MTSVMAARLRPGEHVFVQLLDDLRREHELIERVLGAMRTFVEQLVRGEAERADLDRFIAFFEGYAGAFHHEREEEILIPALVDGAGLPRDRGPLGVILEDHASLAAILARMKAEADALAIRELAIRYSHVLWAHIDVENSVLFPESENQLRRNGIVDLPVPHAPPAVHAAAADGVALIERYPPLLPEIIRGDGCVMCHAYGDTCRGLEREWWNEWAWEELDEHVASS